MADGLNDARAMRVAEVMNDFRTLQHLISQFQASPDLESYYETGFTILRQCALQAQALLSQHFDTGSLQVPSSPGEQTKRQLQRILVDASARRFHAQKIYLRAVAAVRWVNSRNAILQGQKPHAGHTLALQQVENNLRVELSNITDEQVVNSLRMKDWQAGHWLNEDPSLHTILGIIQIQY